MKQQFNSKAGTKKLGVCQEILRNRRPLPFRQLMVEELRQVVGGPTGTQWQRP